MRKLFISAGHSNDPKKDMGAVGVNGLIEGNLTVELRDLIVDRIRDRHVEVIVDADSTVTKDTVAQVRQYLTKNDIAVDIHFNAAESPLATGTEVIIPDVFTREEFRIADFLSDLIADTLGIKNRGVKTESQTARKSLAFMKPDCENILIEVCFITNPNDVNYYQTVKEHLAGAIADFLIIRLDDEVL